MTYPIEDIIPALKATLATHTTAVLEAPPGAGKSTVLPLKLLDEEWLNGRKMVMLEPRRLATKSVANRLSQLHGDRLGQTVGYRVRFEAMTSADTRIEVVTEGILTRMIQTDSTLDGVGAVIFDEFHERSLHADVGLALCKQIQQLIRPDLRILIMSATLDGDHLSAALGGAPVLRSLGRQFPVKKIYVEVDRASSLPVNASRVIRKALIEQQGDVLAFLPGAFEIRRTASLLDEMDLDAEVHELYGDLPFQKQQEALLPNPLGRRKVVLSTSIAETSLTIEGVTTVVDSGLARVPRFDPRSGLTRLETVQATLDAADQRAGRAGRLGPGFCYRMWSLRETDLMRRTRTPEILEADLAPMWLELSAWGIQRIEELNWVVKPPASAVQQATQLLHELGALKDGVITDHGRRMSLLPTHPRIAHLLVTAESNELPVAADLAAVLEERDPLTKEAGTDIVLRLEALRAWRKNGRGVRAFESIERLAASWRKLLRTDIDNSAGIDRTTGKLLLAAYPDRLARQIEADGDRYKLGNGKIVRLPPHDPLHRYPWLVVAQLDAGFEEGRIHAAAYVDVGDLDLATTVDEKVYWDDDAERVVALHQYKIGNLILKERPLHPVPTQKKIHAICEAVIDHGLALLGWDEPHTQWQARVLSLRAWRPEDQWPDVSDVALLARVEEWLSPFLTDVNSRADLLRLNMFEIVNTTLSWSQQQSLDKLAPSRMPVPTGTLIKLKYSPDGSPPEMAVRLQEVFGLMDTPAVNEGHNAVQMHLLSPGYRPVQVTQDLRSFWKNTYAEVRKELRARYPKHAWPEDPYTARPIRK